MILKQINLYFLDKDKNRRIERAGICDKRAYVQSSLLKDVS